MHALAPNVQEILVSHGARTVAGMSTGNRTRANVAAMVSYGMTCSYMVSPIFLRDAEWLERVVALVDSGLYGRIRDQLVAETRGCVRQER